MYCSNCGRVYQEAFCKKCKLDIPEENYFIPDHYKPSVIINLLAFIFSPLFLLFELFIHPKNPRHRSGIECAKKSVIYLFLISVCFLLNIFGMEYISDAFAVFAFVAQFLIIVGIIVMLVIVFTEKRNTMIGK